MAASTVDSISTSDSAVAESGQGEVRGTRSKTDPGPRNRNPASQPLENESGLRRSLRRRWRAATKEEWEQPIVRKPYHEYVHQLVEAGWENLRDLDDYMSEGQGTEPGAPIVISVLDISDDSQLKEWPIISNEHDLSGFIHSQSREGVKVRLYMAEYSGRPRAASIEAFGSSFKLDPRFFKLAINSSGHVFTPAQRHRAPFVNIGFGVLNDATSSRTDAEKFKVLVYIQPDEHGSGWTGIIFFSSRTTIRRSPRIITDPPLFPSKLPPPTGIRPRSFRELYLESLAFIDPAKIAASPFYTVATLFLINSYCWNEVISRIRDEDHRINGISDTSVGHTEEIQRSMDIVRRGGSLVWKGSNEPQATDIKERLEEDFTHLINETDLLWKSRDKTATIRQQAADARWNTLTNAFTYLFAPVTIMSGIYGMNVSQISGSDSNPNIWQFFVAVAVMNVAVVFTLAASNWIHTMIKHRKRLNFKDTFGFAVGRMGGMR